MKNENSDQEEGELTEEEETEKDREFNKSIPLPPTSTLTYPIPSSSTNNSNQRQIIINDYNNERRNDRTWRDKTPISQSNDKRPIRNRYNHQYNHQNQSNYSVSSRHRSPIKRRRSISNSRSPYRQEIKKQTSNLPSSPLSSSRAHSRSRSRSRSKSRKRSLSSTRHPTEIDELYPSIPPPRIRKKSSSPNQLTPPPSNRFSSRTSINVSDSLGNALLKGQFQPIIKDQSPKINDQIINLENKSLINPIEQSTTPEQPEICPRSLNNEKQSIQTPIDVKIPNNTKTKSYQNYEYQINIKNSPNHNKNIKQSFNNNNKTDHEDNNERKLFIGVSPIQAYELIEKLGEGTFGEVYKAIYRGRKYARKQKKIDSSNQEEEDIDTDDDDEWMDDPLIEFKMGVKIGMVVAVKRIIIHNELDGLPITSLREIRILKSLDHPNIVPVIDIAYSKGNYKLKRRGNTYMIFPYLDHDLAGLIENKLINFSVSQIKLYSKQLLMGTAYLHRNKILHRDLKAANLLISNTGQLLIADFGLARSIESQLNRKREYTNCVVTRWYRPPEILLGDRRYGTPVDMWGVGCVIGEMFKGGPILTGSSDINQCELIFRLCGSPSSESMPGWESLPGCEGIRSWSYRPRKVIEEYERISKELADLLDKLLTLDPTRRLTAEGALDHDWFWTDPMPIDPAKLQHYEASHEYDRRKKDERKSTQTQLAAFIGLQPIQSIPKPLPPPPQSQPPRNDFSGAVVSVQSVPISLNPPIVQPHRPTNVYQNSLPPPPDPSMNQPGMLQSYPRPQTQMMHPPLHNQGVGGPSNYREGPPQASYGNIGSHQHINGQHMNGGMRGGGGQHMNGVIGGSGVMSSTSGPAYVGQPQHHHRTGPNRAGGAPHHSYPPSSSSSSSSSRGNSYRPSTRLPQPAPNLSLPPRPLMPYEATNTNNNNNEPPILGSGSKFSIGINNSHSIYNLTGPPQNHNGIVYNHLSGPPPPTTMSYDRSQPILPQSYDRSLSTYNHDRSTNEPNYNTTRNLNNNGYNQQGSSYDRNNNGRGNLRNNNRSSGQRHDRWVPPPNHQPSQRSYPPPSWSTNDNLNPPPPPPPPHSNYRSNGQDDGPPLQY